MNKKLLVIFVLVLIVLSIAHQVFAVGGVIGSIQSKTDTSFTVLQNGASVIVPLSASVQFLGKANNALSKNDIAVGDMLLAPTASGSASRIFIYRPNQKGEQKSVYGTLTGVNGQMLAVLEDGTKDVYYTILMLPTTLTQNTELMHITLTKDDIGKKVLGVGKIEQERVLTGSLVTIATIQ